MRAAPSRGTPAADDERAPSAPAVTGPDAARLDGLTARLRQQVGDARRQHVEGLAPLLPRAQVVGRGRAEVRALAAG